MNSMRYPLRPRNLNDPRYRYKVHARCVSDDCPIVSLNGKTICLKLPEVKCVFIFSISLIQFSM